MTKATYNYSYAFNDPFKFIDNFWTTTATATTATDTYPPYNVIELDEDTRVLELAVAGFEKDEISVSQDNKKLIISAEKAKKDEETKYLHKGIAQRKFTREYALWEFSNVKSVDLNNGILYVVINREIPEEKKPKKFEIK